MGVVLLRMIVLAAILRSGFCLDFWNKIAGLNCPPTHRMFSSFCKCNISLNLILKMLNIVLLFLSHVLPHEVQQDVFMPLEGFCFFIVKFLSYL